MTIRWLDKDNKNVKDNYEDYIHLSKCFDWDEMFNHSRKLQAHQRVELRRRELQAVYFRIVRTPVVQPRAPLQVATTSLHEPRRVRVPACKDIGEIAFGKAIAAIGEEQKLAGSGERVEVSLSIEMKE